MKKALKIVGWLVAILIIAVAGLLTYVKVALPDVGPPEDLAIDYTSQRIERGRYLANHVNVCMDCHSTRDYSKFSGPLVEGTLGQGGDRYDHAVGMPGTFYAKNITPEGIGRYTDGELLRLITTGVTKEGNPMFPFMPYPYYGQMDREDIYSIIAYLRSLSPIKNDVPESTKDFPINFIVHLIPQKASFTTKPAESDTLEYGKYLTNASGCVECHTPVDGGRIIPELAFSGGREFPFADGSIVRASNITPDSETGIGALTKEAFIARFKIYGDSNYVAPQVPAGEFNTYMPWTMYGGMSETDLGAIYTYLRTIEPKKNTFEKWSPATK